MTRYGFAKITVTLIVKGAILLFLVGAFGSVGIVANASIEILGWKMLLFWVPWVASAFLVSRIIERLAKDHDRSNGK